VSRTPLGLAWPADLFSLSHVAIPFSLDDPVYGAAKTGGGAGPIRLGALSPRGERSVLTVPLDTLMRASYNPFFGYMADRVLAWIDNDRVPSPENP